MAGRRAWLVGGAIRDRALGRATADLDVVVDGDPAEAARAIARAAGRAACFALSEEFGAWRVCARDSSWQVDVERLRDGSLEADLALRDFTVNAIAEPIAGGEPIDPLGGLEDLSAGRLRMAAPSAFADDPLRVLRLARIAVELDLQPEPQTVRQARQHAAQLIRCSPERVFAELRRIVAAPRGVARVEADGRARGHARRAARARRAERRRAEPLSPRRCLRAHAGGARAHDRADRCGGRRRAGGRRGAGGRRRGAERARSSPCSPSTGRRWPRCWPSRSRMA